MRTPIPKQRLHAVLPTVSGPQFGAFVANAVTDESVFACAKSVRFGYRFTNLNDFVAGKLDELPAFGAVQVIMLWIPIVMFVHAAAIQFEPIQQTSVHKFSQRSIDSRS